MGHQNMWFVDGEERPCRFALEVANDASRYVLDVERPLTQVGIVNPAERSFDVAVREFPGKMNSTLQ